MAGKNLLACLRKRHFKTNGIFPATNVGKFGLRRESTVTLSRDADDVKPYSDVKTVSLNSPFKMFDMMRRYDRGAKMHLFIHDLHAKLGPIYRVKIGSVDMVFVSDPRSLEVVLRNEGKFPRRVELEMWKTVCRDLGLPEGIGIGEGEHWYKLRKTAEKPFLRIQDVASYAQGVNEVCADLIERFRSKAGPDGSVSNIRDDITLWSVEAIGTILFSDRLGCLGDQLRPDVQQMIQAVQDYFELSHKLSMIPSKVTKIILPKMWKQFESSARVIYSIGQKYTELYKADTENSAQEVPGILGHALQQKHLTDLEVVSMTSEMLAAGVDTTANEVQWIIYMLALHPDIQEKLYDELCRVVSPGEFPTFQDLQEMSILRGVVKETMRLYPVGNTVSRNLPKDLVISGYQIPAGKIVAWSLYTTGRLENIFPEPEVFMPERWSRENRTNQSNAERAFSTLSFGFGTRGCLGRRVAELEMHLLLAQLVQNFRIEPNFTEEIGISMRLLMFPDRPVEVKMIDRKKRAI